MTPKELLIQGLDNVPEPILLEVLDFLDFLKSKQTEDLEDLQEARAALLELGKEDTVSWQVLKMEVGL